MIFRPRQSTWVNLRLIGPRLQISARRHYLEACSLSSQPRSFSTMSRMRGR